ncbi:L-lysine exporter family protein LysE/ArgO [Povalibacter uvarum]|uniref:L-lysine exporter family protein LysE/ArgO n=1 Tax=Povalibacter uvarum TaxID=732238 RepID=A0A841HPF5_9GAMM|nr:LysE/ArgO family amino acid transporter [Povalibacter uvarum]MBB6093942.1 L-lysine exporter family protein LysE/ArgO [Povalibacter uvarum]
MNTAFMTGLVLSTTLIIAIGAQNAFVLRQGLRREHVVPIVAFCIVADFMLIAAGVAGLSTILGDAPMLTTILTFGGVVFLAAYGIRALRNALQPRSMAANGSGSQISLRSALAQAAGFTFLNPHVYLDTILLVGSIGARQPAELRGWFIGGAAVASAGWFSALGFGARLLVPLFARPMAWRILDALVGLTMLTLAALLVRQVLA